MPSLSLSNQTTAISPWYGTTTWYSEDWDSGIGTWAGNNCSVSHDSGNGYLQTVSTSAGGDAYKYVVLAAHTTYSYSVKLAATAIGGGHFNVGTGVTGLLTYDILNLDTPTVATYTGTFTTADLPLSLVRLGLQVDGNSRTLKWDEISITETR